MENKQQVFFEQVKLRLPAHLSLVDELADLLNISNDSAYRRIRGEKQLSFDELSLLCKKYAISFDQIHGLDSNAFVFSGRLNSGAPDEFETYLRHLEQNFAYFNSFEQKHLYILMKDIPPFVHFLIPELALFKFYFWMKSILHDDSFKKLKFSLKDKRYEPFLEASRNIITLYNNIPVTEIWNIESLNSTLRQINFFHESGMYENVEDVQILYQKVLELINHIEKQAELGRKFSIDHAGQLTGGTYQILVNELILGDNTYLAQLGDTQLTFLNHSVLYFVATPDKRFNEAMSENLQNLIKKSTQISVVGEKERTRFFNLLREKTNRSMQDLI